MIDINSEGILYMKVGVIGTGKMGENHVRTYLSLKDHCQLVGIFDNDKNRSLEIAKKYNVKQFASIDALLQAVDAVSIAVPTEVHYDIALACIRNKTHMLMEKPITSTVEQANHLIEKSSNAGIKLQVGHIELFNPLIRILKKELVNEDIIGISFLRLNPYDNRIKDVDVIKDLMIHDLYILTELLQDKIEEYYAIGNVIDNTTKHAAVLIKSSQGITAELLASFKSNRKIRMIQVFTEDAFFEADILNNTIQITRTTQMDSKEITIPLTETIHIDNATQPLNIQLLEFLHCIKCDKSPSVSGEHGRQTLEITNKISELIYK
ncbi:Gfo/Idh/MocA family oxidoreductase [Ralstonia pickettii]|nr:Gfo/Idh/MocA family oxidoreductase [Ralstonia pickettii]